MEKNSNKDQSPRFWGDVVKEIKSSLGIEEQKTHKTAEGAVKHLKRNKRP